MAVVTRALRPTLLFLVLMAALSSYGLKEKPTSGATAPSWEEKVTPGVLEQLESEGEGEFIIFLQEQADLSTASFLSSKEEKGSYVYEQLTRTARQTQRDLLAQLRHAGVEHRSFWIANMLWVRGDPHTLKMVASRPEVLAVYANPRFTLDPITSAAPLQQAPTAVEPNIVVIGAPDVWALDARGQGVVIGGQDTGYHWQHPALMDKYQGWDGDSVDHNYSWHDAIHSGGGDCGPDASEPCDDHGHGTHTMGIMLGDDGGGNQIGVAPDARWIGCRNMDQGSGRPSTYTECFQWFVAPTDLNGENPDPARAPHIINNSWACPPWEQCEAPTILQTVVENVRAAGIVIVSSAGNEGPNCESIRYPPAIYDATLSVGAVDNADNIAGFSSRGPVTEDESNRLKPDIVAPGAGIRSSLPGAGYGRLSGTSMAAPHVAGLVALLISAKPPLSGDVAALEAAIMSSAVPLTSEQNCGDISGDSVPNHTFGYGRIDALEAYDYVAHMRRYYAPAMFDQQ